jgi:hypothetical protein
MSLSVTYNGNGSTGGSVPVDPNSYNSGNTVTVLGNTGNLTEPGGTFIYWNTAANGTGTLYGPGATFNITADVTLYAQWLVTTGLTNGGVTTHYAFSYDSALQKTAANPTGPEPARTNALISFCEGDYNIVAGWFGNISLTIPVPIVTHVINAGGGAGWGPPLTLKPGSGDANLCRYLVVSELTEMFEYAQNQGWFAPNGSNEQSCGEGLSRFCGQQFLVATGIGTYEPGYAISPSWLNSSLPTSNSSSTQLGGQLTTLSAAINNMVTSFAVAKAPTIPFETEYIIQIDSEQMQVTNADTSTNILSVTRGYNGTAPASHAAQAQVFENYGSRADDINTTLEYDHGIDAATGCAMLFLYYLQVQLGFSINAIIAAAPGAANAGSCLRGVYQNLTGDTSDPFPYFKQLLDNAFPPNLPSSIPGPNPDNPWPLGSLTFWGVKNTYGHDEVSDIISKSGGVYPTGFWLALDGFNRKLVGSTTPSTPAVAFGGVTTSPDASGIAYESNNILVPQRILFPYDVDFASSALNNFPSSGETPAAVTSKISVLGLNLPASTEFFFTAGADPYFTNVLPNAIPAQGSTPSEGNVPWLSQDLRVFTATPGQPGGQVPVPSAQFVPPAHYTLPSGAPTFAEHSMGGSYDINGAYTYIQALLTYLNNNFSDPNNVDPFDVNNSILPGQLTAYTGDSSVTPTTTVGGKTYNNYSFGLARVRLRGSSGPTTNPVRVFFRLWGTQTADTDWDPSYTYLSNDPTGINPTYPEAPSDNHTIPFFATGNYPNTDDTANTQIMKIPSGADQVWAYFGCFLNVNGPPDLTVNGVEVSHAFPGTHHCLVAEIAYQGAPIENVGTDIETTENSDQLAQRNLQVTTSDNPGSPATHRVPQTFDVRPSLPTTVTQGLLSYPDELMINWGNTPIGSTASIYWPQVNSADVLTLASEMYGTQVLSASDSHTIQCTTSKNVTYVPIPFGTGDSFAGLFTVDLPPTVVKGQEFNIVVRRISTRRLKNVPPPPPPPPPPQIKSAAKTARVAGVNAVDRDLLAERYVVGSFQVKIPVETKKTMLPAEETTLAIFKARLGAMSPSNRWYPVLLRYIGLLSARVNGLGGNASSIPASFSGYSGPVIGEGGEGRRRPRAEYTGKVAGLIFDHFGDFEGFLLETDCSEHTFLSRERAIEELAERAWHERLRITVRAECQEFHRPLSIIVREPPVPFRH